jgi:hypothetical protein
MNTTIVQDYMIKIKSFERNIEFPSFVMSNDVYEEEMKNVIKEKLIDAINSDRYDTKSLFGASYRHFVDAEKKKESSLMLTSKQEKMLRFWNEIVPLKMEKDKNMDKLDIQRIALFNGISNRVQDILVNISFHNMMNMDGNDLIKKEENVERNKLTATLLILQKDFPVVYTQMLPSLRLNDVFNSIEKTIDNPNDEVIFEVYKANEITATALFPLHIEKIKMNKGVSMRP